MVIYHISPPSTKKTIKMFKLKQPYVHKTRHKMLDDALNTNNKKISKFIESKNLTLLSQKIIFNDLLIKYSDQNILKLIQ